MSRRELNEILKDFYDIQLIHAKLLNTHYRPESSESRWVPHFLKKKEPMRIEEIDVDDEKALNQPASISLDIMPFKHETCGRKFGG